MTPEVTAKLLEMDQSRFWLLAKKALNGNPGIDYSIDEAFDIMVYYNLTDFLELNDLAAGQVMEDLEEWRESRGLMPTGSGPKGIRAVDWQVRMYRKAGGGFFYKARNISPENQENLTVKDRAYVVKTDRYIEEYPLELKPGEEFHSGIVLVLRIGMLLSMFLTKMQGLREVKEGREQFQKEALAMRTLH